VSTIGAYQPGSRVRLRCVFGVNPTSLAAQAAKGASSITVRDASGFAPADALVLDPGHTAPDDPLREEKAVVQSVSGRVVVLAAPLGYDHPAGADVWELADPTTVTLKVLAPDGTTASYTYALGQILKAGQGDYYYDTTFTAEGDYARRWEGTGACIAVDEGRFRVLNSEFG
jgi:hypothetical protein